MSPESVCAVIVTYHPTQKMIAHISSVVGQVDGLVVVDNGSAEQELAALRAAGESLGFCLIENQKNLGIAEALNIGVRRAIAQDFPWVILFDQDSEVPAGFVQNMLASWKSHHRRDLIGSLHPRYVDPDTGVAPPVYRASDGGPVISLTSGALMPTWIFERIGEFASDYFIDEVDTEYCFRIRANGYLVADSQAAALIHHVGHPRTKNILGFSFRPTFHDSLRRYYMSRNRVVVYRKYLWKFPGWVLHSANESLRETVKCFLGEPDRIAKIRNFIVGTWDGLAGNMGKKDSI